MTTIIPTWKNSELRSDLKDFCKTYFPAAVHMFEKDAGLDRQIEITSYKEPGREHAIEINEGESALYINSDVAASDIAKIYAKWGCLKDSACILSGKLIIPLDDIIHIRLELVVLAVCPEE